MSSTPTIPGFARELSDEELATTHGGRTDIIVIVLEDGTIIVIVLR